MSGTNESVERSTAKIAAISKAASILRCFDKQHLSFSLAELSQCTGYAKTTLFGLANTLEEEGLLDRDVNSNKYVLGLKLLEFAYLVKKNLPIVQIGGTILERLCSHTEQNAYLTTHSKGRLLYIEACYKGRDYVGYSETGKTLPMHCTASGKAMLSRMTNEQVDTILAYHPLIASTPNTITDAAQLRRELEQIRKQGYALDMEEEDIGVVCIAMPVLNTSGVPVGAVSLSGSATIMTEEKRAECAEAINNQMPLLRSNAAYFPYQFL